jgi:hypothetical protein
MNSITFFSAATEHPDATTSLWPFTQLRETPSVPDVGRLVVRCHAPYEQDAHRCGCVIYHINPSIKHAVIGGAGLAGMRACCQLIALHAHKPTSALPVRDYSSSILRTLPQADTVYPYSRQAFIPESLAIPPQGSKPRLQ